MSKYISKIQMPDGLQYTLKDSEAQGALALKADKSALEATDRTLADVKTTVDNLLLDDATVITGELTGTQTAEEYLNSLDEEFSVGDRAVLRRLLAPAIEGKKYTGYENIHTTEPYRIGMTFDTIDKSQPGVVYYHITPAMRRSFEGFCIVREGSMPFTTDLNFMATCFWYSDEASLLGFNPISFNFSDYAILARPSDTLVVRVTITGTQKVVGAYLYNGELPLGYVPIDKSMFLSAYDKEYQRIAWPYDNSKLGMVLTSTGARNFTALIPGDDENSGNLGLFSCPYLVIVPDPINSSGPISTDIRAWTPAGDVIIDTINGTDAKLSNSGGVRCFDLTRVGDCSPMFLEIWVTDASLGIKDIFLSRTPITSDAELTAANVGAGYVTASPAFKIDVYLDKSKSNFGYSVMVPSNEEYSLPYVNSIITTNTDRWINLADNTEFTCPHTFSEGLSVCPAFELSLSYNHYVPRNVTSQSHTHPLLTVYEYPAQNYIRAYNTTYGNGGLWFSFIYERQSLGQSIDFTFTNNINKYVPEITNSSHMANYCINIGYSDSKDVPPASSTIKPQALCTLDEVKWGTGSEDYGAQTGKYVWVIIYIMSSGYVGMEYPYLTNYSSTGSLPSPVKVVFSDGVESAQICYYKPVTNTAGTLDGRVAPPKAVKYGYDLIGWRSEDSNELIDFTTLVNPTTIASINNKTLVPVFEKKHAVTRAMRYYGLPTRYGYESYFYDGENWNIEDQAVDENIVAMLRDIDIVAGNDKNVLLGTVPACNSSPSTAMSQMESNRVWTSLEAAQEFARTSPAAYPGMVLAVLDMDDGNVVSSSSYRINDSQGNLVNLDISASVEEQLNDKVDKVDGQGLISIDIASRFSTDEHGLVFRMEQNQGIKLLDNNNLGFAFRTLGNVAYMFPYPWNNTTLSCLGSPDAKITESHVSTGVFDKIMFGGITHGNETSTVCTVSNISPSTTSVPCQGLSVDGHILPSANVFTSNWSLGSQPYPWTYIWGYNISGTIVNANAIYINGQAVTSDRDAKCNIEYIYVPATSTFSLRAPAVEMPSTITQDDIIDFVKNIQPTTYIYKNNGEDQTYENANPIDVQLGLIADDICDLPIFKFVGNEETKEVMVTPAQFDEDGTLVSAPVYEEKVCRGLKPLPLTVAALTACRNLYETIEMMQYRIDDLESRLSGEVEYA